MLNFNNEIWKPVVGFKGYYEISNFGKVKSLKREVPNTLKSKRQIKERIKKTHIRSGNYLYFTMSKNQITYNEAVHRAVAKAFIPNPENKPMVNHMDGNKLNNNACNLEWVTCSENHLHAFKIGLRSKDKSAKRMIGTRRSKHSIYRNVSWDSSRKKWIGGVKHNGKLLKSKRFNTEIEAAKHVNYIIDIYNLDRPKNIIK